MTTIYEQLSQPAFTFTDTYTDAGARTIILPRPKSFSVADVPKKSVRESNSGRTETLFYFSRHVLEIEWEFLPLGDPTEDGMLALRHLWESCKDGTAFEFQRHYAITSGGYPDASIEDQIHANTWDVKFDVGQAFEVENARGVKDRYNVKLRLMEVLDASN
jgi:hypothetical protein